MPQKLRLTHLEEYSGHWVIRFQGSAELFNRMKDTLKSEGAHWKKAYHFDDNEVGGWMIDKDILAFYQDHFTNYVPMIARALTEDTEEYDEPIFIHDFLKQEKKRQVYIPSHVREALRVFGLEDLPGKDTLKKTYWALSRKFHPDLGGNENIMREINKARDTINEWRETCEQVTDWHPFPAA